MILQDVLKPDLDIVFCGSAVGSASALKQAYYAGNGNKFYSTLAKTGLTPVLLLPAQYLNVLDYNLGLTDMVKNVSGSDSILKKDDFDIEGFKKKILNYQPKLVCFNGKAAAASFLSKKTKDIEYGLLPDKIGATKLFVAPSTSGNANGVWDESYWFMLREFIGNNALNKK